MSIVQEIMLRSTDDCSSSSRHLEDKEESQCLTCARTAIVSHWKTTLVGLWEKTYEVVVQPTRLFVVQTVIVLSRPKSSKHMQCSGFVRTFNQCIEVTGESARRWRRPLAKVVKDLRKESRKGLTDGLREFIKVDNERALDVGSEAGAREHFKYESRSARRVP